MCVFPEAKAIFVPSNKRSNVDCFFMTKLMIQLMDYNNEIIITILTILVTEQQ